MRFKISLIPLLTLCWFTTTIAAENCFTQKYAQYSDAKVRWQKASTALVIERKPELASVANLYMQDQLTLIAKRRLAVELVAKLSPGRLDTAFHLDSWLYLNDKVEQALARRDARYAELLRKEAEAKARPPHPDGNALRAAMRKEIMVLPEFKALLDKLKTETDDANSIVCQPAKP
jgi:hypothetical protein